jgi:hypothetical protein
MAKRKTTIRHSLYLYCYIWLGSRTQQKNRGELRYSRGVSSPCSSIDTQSVTLVKHLVISQRGRGCSYNKWNINVVICVRHSQTYFSHQHSHIWYGVLIYIVWACLLGYNFPNRSVNGICSPFSNFLNAIFRISVQYFIFLGNLFLHLLIEHIHIL